MDLKAKVQYKNRKQQVVHEVEYALPDYTDVLSMDMKRIISDVEDLIYTLNNNAPKEEWSTETLLQFDKIKRKLLDKAGELSRLPDCIYDGDAVKNSDSPSRFWDRVFSDKRS